jgi:hypothetical protein
MHVVVTQEDTLFETELELVGIKWSKIGPIRTTKGASATVLGFFLKKHSSGEEKSRVLVGRQFIK